VCEDDRQYVGWKGQLWTDLDSLLDGHHPVIREEGAGVLGIGIEPSVAIGQRALLVQTGAGNVLWDCIPYLDDHVVAQVRARGGLRAIAISHPHFYGAMVDWAHAFDAPVYIHAGDRSWVPRPDAAVELWDGDTLELGDGVTLVNAGVHFAGGTVLHWRDGEAGAGALFSGDIFQVVMDRRWVSFMYSYPNLIPERPRVIERAVQLIGPLPFTRLYGAWWGRIVGPDAKGAVHRSAERYLARMADADPGAGRE
jgi:hypothetical protein